MAELRVTLDEVFRRDRGRVVAALVRALGSIDAAEEAFQEAVLSALATWPERGVPDSPAAWLMTAAKNRARDAERHRKVVDAKAPAITWAETSMSSADTFESVADDQLRLIFTCCHPALPRESQVALTLKLIAGFSIEEIARAFLSPETTIAQRIVRAKRTLAAANVPFETPTGPELIERLPAVLGEFRRARPRHRLVEACPAQEEEAADDLLALEERAVHQRALAAA